MKHRSVIPKALFLYVTLRDKTSDFSEFVQSCFSNQCFAEAGAVLNLFSSVCHIIFDRNLFLDWGREGASSHSLSGHTPSNIMVNIERLYFPGQVRLISIDSHVQGCMARKVISEMYTSFVLQCTVSGRKRNEGMESWPQTSRP